MRRASSFALGLFALASACERAPAAAPKPSGDAKGLPEVQRARAGVEAADKASEERTDQALDRATKGEQVERGTPSR